MIANPEQLKPLIDALTSVFGLPENLQVLEIRIAVNEPVHIKFEYCPGEINANGVKQLATVENFKLNRRM